MGSKAPSNVFTGSYTFGNFLKVKYFNRKHFSTPAIIRAEGHQERLPQFWGPQRWPGRKARSPGARACRGVFVEMAAPRQEGLPEAGPGVGGKVVGTQAKCDFPYLNKPAEHAKEPVLAVDRAPYAVSAGHHLLVLVPTWRRRRRIAVHDVRPPECYISAGSRPRRRETRAPRAPAAAPATAPPAVRSPAGPSAGPTNLTQAWEPRYLITPTTLYPESRRDHIYDCYLPPSLDWVFHLPTYSVLGCTGHVYFAIRPRLLHL